MDKRKQCISILNKCLDIGERTEFVASVEFTAIANAVNVQIYTKESLMEKNLLVRVYTSSLVFFDWPEDKLHGLHNVLDSVLNGEFVWEGDQA
ncbi:hypothetical protein ACFOQM_12605 [Paenibacillus sp. GCM10012307]|uniref:Uncharacterized protein n=1 Tax=Paenibacillus roseus TaxID=2798579 RepID=A0A934J5U5_9BACL|nr:hypothetical protein [Paenibacillus roseus]MBJ6362133.1 hypothetical protein [Paenibacillus roseus]